MDTRGRQWPHGSQLLGKKDADYDIVLERLGPHPGPREMRCEGLCGVQCVFGGRRKAAQPRSPSGPLQRAKPSEIKFEAKESEPAPGTAQAVAL